MMDRQTGSLGSVFITASLLLLLLLLLQLYRRVCRLARQHQRCLGAAQLGAVHAGRGPTRRLPVSPGGECPLARSAGVPSPSADLVKCVTCVPQKSVVIRGVEVPVHLVGDPSFPLRPWLMKAYGQRSGISSERRRFGRSLSSAQAVVGAAFSRLRGRWGYLLKRSEMDLSTLAKVVTACCVLHNVCEQCGDDFLPEWNADASPGESHLKQPETEPHDEAASSTAEAIRDTLSGCLLTMLQD